MERISKPDLTALLAAISIASGTLATVCQPAVAKTATTNGAMFIAEKKAGDGKDAPSSCGPGMCGKDMKGKKEQPKQAAKTKQTSGKAKAGAAKASDGSTGAADKSSK